MKTQGIEVDLGILECLQAVGPRESFIDRGGTIGSKACVDEGLLLRRKKTCGIRIVVDEEVGGERHKDCE